MREKYGTERLDTYTAAGEVDVDLYISPELTKIGSYLIKNATAYASLGKGKKLPEGARIAFFETRIPIFRRTKKGAVHCGATKHKGGEDYEILVDERLNEHEKIAVTAHELGHILGGYKRDDKKAQKLAIKELTNIIRGYALLARQDVRETLRRDAGVDLNVREVSERQLRESLQYLINTGEYFDVSQADWEESGLKVARQKSGLEKLLEKIFGIIFLVLGVIFLANSFSGLTGFVIFDDVTARSSGIVGLIFVGVGVVLVMMASGRGRHSGLVRMIFSKKHPYIKSLSIKEKTFRRKLTNLFDKQKDIDSKKLAYLLPQYDKVRRTGEYIPGHNYIVFEGRRGNKEEYFTVDTRETVNMEIGNKSIPLPTHIDIQKRLGTNHYEKIDEEQIDWATLLKHSDDILDYFSRKPRKIYPSS